MGGKRLLTFFAWKVQPIEPKLVFPPKKRLPFIFRLDYPWKPTWHLKIDPKTEIPNDSYWKAPSILGRAHIDFLVGGFFPPISKNMFVKLEIFPFPNFRGENKKYLKPPPR